MKSKSIKLEDFIKETPKFYKNVKITEQTKSDVEQEFISSLRLTNNSLTLVTLDGDIYTLNSATVQDYWAVHNAINLECALKVLTQMPLDAKEQIKQAQEAARNYNIIQNINVLKKYNDFEVLPDKVIFTLSGRTVPPLLVDKFIDIIQFYESNGVNPVEEDEYKAYKRFFIWCCLNPRAEIAAELYRFLTENSFRITKQGFFVALRNVVTLHGSPQLVHFVSNMYQKVKAVWKTNPLDYYIFEQNNEFLMVDINTIDDEKFINGEYGKKVGGLVELYLDLPNRAENRFTDDWTKTFDIRIGRLVQMPFEDCNWSTQDCAAAGLHFTADQIHYVGCGDQSVLVLINPMKVVGIGKFKGRCYEYLPIMTVPREEATEILHNDAFDTLQLDEKYAVRCLKDLEETVTNNFVKETQKQEHNLSALNMKSLSAMVTELSDIKEELLNRIVNIE